MRFGRLFVVALFCWIDGSLPAQDHPDARVDRLLQRIDQVLQEETGRIRRELVELVRAEFAVRTQDGKESATALDLITVDLLKSHVGTLASDEYEGRNAGYPGNDKAAAYCAEVFRKAGLKPGGDDGTYLQHFEFRSFETGGKKLKTQNVVGWLEGSDATLKKEYVVVGGHFDHLGKDGQGEHFGRMGRATDEDGIWNGADDNASGTSCVLALAKAFGEGALHTKRSVIFLCFSAEEAGLYGSKYYCAHPIAPIEDHVFMLNLDMVGRNPNKAVQVMGLGTGAAGVLRKAAEEAVAKAGLKAKLEDGSTIFGGDSDHSSFQSKGVPAAFFFTDFHADYHRPSDHPEKLAYENMVKISKTAAHLLIAVADRAERPVFAGKTGRNPLDFGGEDPAPSRPSRRLGIEADELSEEQCKDLGLEEDQGGLKVTSVGKGSVAQTAGLRTGDVVLSLGGTKLGRRAPRADIRKALEGVKPGKDVEVVVFRDGKRATLTARWEK